MSAPIRILLADDHPVLRQGTAQLLQRKSDLLVVGEANDGQEAIELAAQLKPDVIVMDVRMPQLTGVEATRRIRARFPEVNVLVLTAHKDDEYLFASLEAGAGGYLLKTAPVSELIQAIREVHRGQMPLDPAITRTLMRRSDRHRSTSAAEDPPSDPLTAREFEVLRCLAKGMSNRAIAEQLVISERTVQTHLTNIFSKMHVTSRTEALTTAIRRGWLNLDP